MAIIYTFHKSEIKGKLLCIVNNMNQDLTARIYRALSMTSQGKLR